MKPTCPSPLQLVFHYQVRSRSPITHPWITSTAKSSITSWSFNLIARELSPSGLTVWRLIRALQCSHSVLVLNLLKQQQLKIMGDHCAPCGKPVGDHALIATRETPTGWSLRLNHNFTKGYRGSARKLSLEQSFKTLVCRQSPSMATKHFSCISLVLLWQSWC